MDPTLAILTSRSYIRSLTNYVFISIPFDFLTFLRQERFYKIDAILIVNLHPPLANLIILPFVHNLETCKTWNNMYGIPPFLIVPHYLRRVPPLVTAHATCVQACGRIHLWLYPNRAILASHTFCYADRNLYYANLLDLGSRPGDARSPSMYIAGIDDECCISISLRPLHASWGNPEVELTTMSILNPSREWGRTEYLRVNDLMPKWSHTSISKRTHPNPFDPHLRYKSWWFTKKRLHHRFWSTIC